MLNFCRNVVSVILVVVIVVVVTLIFDQAGIIGASPPPAVQPAPVYILPTPIIPTAVPTIAPTAVPTTAPVIPTAPNDPPTRLVSMALGLDVAVVSSPSVQLDFAVMPVAPPSNAAAWWADSGVPGHLGNVVIYGHNATAFAPLAGAKVGHQFDVYTARGVYRYVVAEIVILAQEGPSVTTEEKIENGRYIRPFDDERLTLVTCWPFPAGTSHRFIVIAKRS